MINYCYCLISNHRDNSINAIIFSNYIIGAVYCEKRSHPWRHVKHSFHPADIRHPDSKFRALVRMMAAPKKTAGMLAKYLRHNLSFKKEICVKTFKINLWILPRPLISRKGGKLHTSMKLSEHLMVVGLWKARHIPCY